jgi:hypothetical protein
MQHVARDLAELRTSHRTRRPDRSETDRETFHGESQLLETPKTNKRNDTDGTRRLVCTLREDGNEKKMNAASNDKNVQ